MPYYKFKNNNFGNKYPNQPETLTFIADDYRKAITRMQVWQAENDLPIYEVTKNDLEKINAESIKIPEQEEYYNWGQIEKDFNPNYHPKKLNGLTPVPKKQEKPISTEKAQKQHNTKTTTISDLFKYKSLSKYTGLEGKQEIRAETTFVGIEIELEKVELKHVPASTWNMTDDGSLKDRGKEFVTIPIQFKYVEVELERLFGSLNNCNPSERCSVHVHINARDFTLEELKKFIALYMIFEKSFYNFSGERLNNNFCVPVVFYPEIAKQFVQNLSLGSIFPLWFKYYGFNLSPIFGGESDAIGTIEFRHMKGTTDISWIINWINLIVSLKISAKSMKLEDIEKYLATMNTTSAYYWLADHVFKQFAPFITKQTTFKEDVEHCITVAKTVFAGNESTKCHEEIEIIKTK